MQIRVVRHDAANLDKVVAGLRHTLDGSAEIVSRRSVRKTVEVFGEPLSAREVVARIISDVRADGDAAVARYTRKLDDVALRPADFRIPPADIRAALDAAPAELVGSLRIAADLIRNFQETLKADAPEPKVTSAGAVL